MARGWLAFLLATGAMALPPASGAQALTGTDDVLGTVTTTAGTVTSTLDAATSTVGDAADTATSTSGSVGPAATGTATSLLGGGGTDPASSVLGGSGSSPSGQSTTSGGASASRDGSGRSGRASPGRAYHTRFDRLPRRAEVLLERIELGRHVHANLRRLRALLATHPRLENAVLRSIRAELRRLRTGGLSPSERKNAERLRAVRHALRRGLEGTAEPRAGRVSPTVGDADAARAEGISSGETHPRTVQEGIAAREAGATAPSRDGSLGSFLGRLPRPGGGGSGSWLADVLYGLAWVVVAGLLVIIGREFRSVLRQG